MRNAVSRPLAAAAACWAAFSAPAAARAQSCHLPPPIVRAEEAFTAALRAESAGFDNSRYEGHYEGIAPSVAFRQAWFEAALSAPMYRILRNGRADTGPGDLLVQTRAALLRDRPHGAVAGVELAASLPTGDPKNELGMGHFMLMPSAWGTLTLSRFGLSARAGYARALMGSSEHHHHAGGTSPLVDPMNTSELDAALAASLSVTALVGVHAGIYGAAPVAVDDGRARAAGFAGVAADARRVSTKLEVHVPFAGDPFTGKLLLELATRF